MKIKFNNGNRALLCDKCCTIVATGERIPKEVSTTNESNNLYFCSEKCLEEYIDSIKKRSKVIKVPF
jgi:ribosomal protein L24E